MGEQAEGEQASRLRIAVDIGGTFTDGIIESLEDGQIWLAKSLTTPNDPGEAVSAVITSLLEQTKAIGGAAAVRELVHGTTRVANAIIEGDGAKVGLLVTTGTKDTLDIRREVRYDLYDLNIEYPKPMAAPNRRYEIAERIAFDGEIVAPLPEAEVIAAVEKLRAQGVTAVAVCFLHACVNDVHERRAGEIIAAHWPEVALSLSSGVAREIREYERMSTVAANAFVQPLMSDYLNRLETRMGEAGINAPLRIMVSSGGFTSSKAAAKVPIALLESGPAGGVLSAVHSAQGSGADNLMAFDMGGTTAKACVVSNGQPEIAHSFEAGRVRRFKKGSGYPILLPSIDLIEIGAGGGSIAHKSTLGLLNVGPRSAGAAPGPACYGLGGREPTVTDADLLLGYLDPAHFLGGEMPLYEDKAMAAMARLANELSMPAEDLIYGVFDLVNENMAMAARVHVAEKGLDPRRLMMVATGGAGPVHAVEVAQKIGMKQVLCGVAAGAGSCLGLLVAPMRVERSWSKATSLDHANWPDSSAMLASMQADAAEEARGAGGDEDMQWRLRLDMRYAGQGDTIAVELPFITLDENSRATIEAGFEQRYVALYGRTVPKASLEIVTWRLIGQSAAIPRRFSLQRGGGFSSAPLGKRRMFRADSRQWAETPVYDRYRLAPGTKLSGPAILQERESTLLVARAAEIEILEDQSVMITLASDS